MKKKLFVKLPIILIVTATILVGLTMLLYLKVLPYAVSHPKTISFAQKSAKKYLNVELQIEEPKLHTELKPNIGFGVKRLYLGKDDKKLVELNKFDSAFSLKEVHLKNIIVKKLVADNIFVDVSEVESLLPKSDEKEKKPLEWNFYIDNALFGVNHCEILYKLQPDTNIRLLGKHIGVNNAEKIKRNVYFKLNADVERNSKHVTVKLNDEGNVFFQDNKFHIENCPISINNSNVFINLLADKKRNYNIELFSKNFNVNDVIEFLNTQIIENNVHEILSYFDNINGAFDFKLNIVNNNFDGNIKLNKVNFMVLPVDSIPITLTKGNIALNTKEVKLENFEGYYDNNVQNKLNFKGTVKDYLKTMDMNLEGDALANSSFFKKHLSRMVETPLDIKGQARTRVNLKSKNNIMDIVWYFMLKPGENIKVANDYLPFEDSMRLMKSDMHLENMILDVKSLDYHMISQEKIQEIREKRQKGEKRNPNHKPKPIFRLSSSVDLAHNNHVKFVGFEIPEPLQSELLNVVLKQEIFKKGKIGGKLLVDNSGTYPTLQGSMNMDRVLIPSQRTFIKEAVLNAENNIIKLTSEGGYKRARFKFSGDILNELKFPVIVKDANLSVEHVDLLRLLENSASDSKSQENVVVTDTGNIKVEDNGNDFDISNIIIEKGKFHLGSGTYKDIAFSNLDADLSLNKDSILDIKSNRFEIAEGHSSVKVSCDLKNQKYNVILGVLNVNADTIAKSLLDLNNEISGKASGFININTDKSLKLNGNIKFKIADGTIEKIGLVEYVLKFAAIFRNPVAMISPGIFADIVNMPEGKFDKITGSLEIKNNVARRIKIKTYSPQLSTYIAGRYNMDNKDTSLRIYTKFSSSRKGFGGFLRNLSLNALATRIPLSSRNDANYYAVELAELPEIDADEKDCQIFLTKVEGDVENNNYISSLKKIK